MSAFYAIQFSITFRLLIAFIAGLLIGYDREKSGKAAGIKTQMLVCVGSALFTGISIFIGKSLNVNSNQPSLIMAQIVTGIGFLGAGVILKNGNHLSGVTTAATIWTTAAVGVAIGCGFFVPAALTVFLVLMLNPIGYLQYKFGSKRSTYVLSFEKKSMKDVMDFLDLERLRVSHKAILQSEVRFHLLSSEKKNEKLIEYLNDKDIKFSLEPTED
jgi:putative Mg2+ transporter-C (MgtC) family protein